MLFCQVSTQSVGELMQSPELAISMMQDMGFSVEDQLTDAQMLSILESRYQGSEQTFTLEAFSHAAQLVWLDYLDVSVHSLLFSGGKPSEILLDGSPIHVLSPLEVSRIAESMALADLTSIQVEWANSEKLVKALPQEGEDQETLFWMLFPGLFFFFEKAHQEKHCVLRA